MASSAAWCRSTTCATGRPQLADGEVIDLGGKRVRHIDTPHVPHGWEARVLFEETTRTLLCGDLFTHAGNGPALTDQRHRRAGARRGRNVSRDRALAAPAPTIRRLAALEPRMLA